MGGAIHGAVVDGSNNDPLPYSTIAIYNVKDSSLATGTLADAEGTFRLEGMKPGRYYARVSFVGYRTKIVTGVTISPTTSNLDLGTIPLTESATGAEVVVKGQREFMTSAIDRTIYKTEDLKVASGEPPPISSATSPRWKWISTATCRCVATRMLP